MRLLSYFEPTEEFKSALGKVKPGDILYLWQGPVPRNQFTGYQIIVQMEKGKAYVSYGNHTLSDLKVLRKAVLNRSEWPEMVYPVPISFNSNTGHVEDHMLLKVTKIHKNGACIQIYPNLSLYYNLQYGMVCILALGTIATLLILFKFLGFF